MRFIPDEIVGTMAYGKFAGILPDLSCCVHLFRWTGCEEVYAEQVIVPPSPEVTALAQALQTGERVWVLYWDDKPVGLRR